VGDNTHLRASLAAHLPTVCCMLCHVATPDVRQVLSMLAPQRKAIYAQRNYFFDSPDGRVSKFRRTLRIRFFDDDKAVLTIKVCLGPVTWHLSGCSTSMPAEIDRYAVSAECTKNAC
jgi:CYTH domain